MLGTLYWILFFQAYITVSKPHWIAKGARSNDTRSYVSIERDLVEPPLQRAGTSPTSSGCPELHPT